MDVTTFDYRVISAVDLDGDGHFDVWERAIGGSNTVTDWGDVADQVDERIAESPSWPTLNAELVRAAALGYDPTAGLPRLAATAELPAHDPAAELYYRLLDSGAAGTLSGDHGLGRWQGTTPPRHDNPPPGATAPTPAPAPGLR